MAKTVLQEKQAILKLPQHTRILDVRTRWNSLHLILERFLEQYPAIQAASLDQRLRKPMERDRLARFTEEDLRWAEDFIRLMRVIYTSTLCVSSENNPTSGQILPILKKLEMQLDTVFVSNLKKQVWGNLSNVTRVMKSGAFWKRLLLWIHASNKRWTIMLLSGTGSRGSSWPKI
ncbi:hypothetical protein CesoFtcFv8_024794 [Champsocephalus esox]|uniref:Uncharacterized protein n=1 Tax=Champsocephalus esox TaxID=159716 RepID=A0AAN8B2K7_9TELE|nr:hypothetical protein CesoFtcFv8_024794 [Champsocephalus esox]